MLLENNQLKKALRGKPITNKGTFSYVESKRKVSIAEFILMKEQFDLNNKSVLAKQLIAFIAEQSS